MATIYGMSDIAGFMVLERRTNQFLGGQTQKISQMLWQKI